jgi:hypothetical protein
MAEAFNSIFKAELVRNKGPWQGIGDLEPAVAAAQSRAASQPPTPQAPTRRCA